MRCGALRFPRSAEATAPPPGGRCTCLGPGARVPNTEVMTQRVELATVLDRLAVDTLVTEYARAVAGGDPEACRPLCVPGAVLDDPVLDVRQENRGRTVPRPQGRDEGRRPYQHLIVNRRVAFERREGEVGDLAVVDADFVTPMRSNGPGRIADTVRGGRYRMRGVRTAEGWRLSEVVAQEVWQGGASVAGPN